jgi:hypothetical protein
MKVQSYAAKGARSIQPGLRPIGGNRLWLWLAALIHEMQFPGFWIAATGYSRFVRKLLTQNAIFFLTASLAALALRLAFVFYFPAVVDDSRLYANIAENWLQHGVYGVTNDGHIMPTLSRLPGYPAFLAMIFAVFGIDDFRAVLIVQVLFDLGTCFLIANMARRGFSERAAKAAFLLAALCPFLANYSAAALTETWRFSSPLWH